MINSLFIVLILIYATTVAQMDDTIIFFTKNNFKVKLIFTGF